MQGDRHRLQGVWIGTCSCETSRKLFCLRTREEDLESSSSTSSSSRFGTKQHIQPFSVKQFRKCNVQNVFFGNQGIVHCICGLLFRESQSSQHLHRWQMDMLSIQKERSHGARHGKTAAQKKHFTAHKVRRRFLKQKFEGIHYSYRDSKLKIGWVEETCIAMVKFVQENHSCCPLLEELTLNKPGRNEPMKLRSDFREALANMHRLRRESGERRLEPIHLINTKGGNRRLLHLVFHGGSGTNTGGAH